MELHGSPYAKDIRVFLTASVFFLAKSTKSYPISTHALILGLLLNLIIDSHGNIHCTFSAFVQVFLTASVFCLAPVFLQKSTTSTLIKSHY